MLDRLFVGVPWEPSRMLGTLAIQTTVLVVTAAVLAPLLGRRSAAARHLVWAIALAGVLVSPLISLLVHTLPPQWIQRSMPVSATQWTEATAATVSPIVSGTAAFAGWALGVAFVLAFLGRSLTACAALLHRAVPHPDAATTTACRYVAAQLGVRGRVRLLEGPDYAMPMAWGVRHPVVLLPHAAVAWTPAVRDAVLRHELAHVRRADVVWALVSELACAVCWFHPGVWLARVARRRWQERAADALAVGNGGDRYEYAAALVAAARVIVTTRRAFLSPFSAEVATGLMAPPLGRRGGLADRLRALTASEPPALQCTRLERASVGVGMTGGALVSVIAATLSVAPVESAVTEPAPRSHAWRDSATIRPAPTIAPPPPTRRAPRQTAAPGGSVVRPTAAHEYGDRAEALRQAPLERPVETPVQISLPVPVVVPTTDASVEIP